MPGRPPRATVPSPCIEVCRIDPASGLCEGCQRSLPEIAAWSTMTDDAKRALWRTIAQRRTERRAAAAAREEGAR